MAAGYFVCESVMFGVVTAAASIVGNLIQLAGGVVISAPVWYALKKFALPQKAKIS